MNKTFHTEHIAECRRIIREGSKSFYFASLMLPSQVRTAASALYAFCRVSDDIADKPNATMESVANLRKRIENSYAGNPDQHPADQAFSAVVQHYEIPMDIPMSMIEGFEWDLCGKKYETLSDVIDYSARVAGTVGVMMSIVMGRRNETTLARACDLGVSMQLINIARDVGEDARNGRLYLPSEWLLEAGVNPEEFLTKPEFSKAIGRVVEQLLARANELYSRGMTGIADLPASCRPGIRAAGMVYAEIGEKVRQNGFNSIDKRAYTTRSRKLGLVLTSPGNPLDVTGSDPAAPLPEVTYLIEAAKRDSDVPFGDGEWLVGLFADLSERDQKYLEEARRPGHAGSVS